MGIAAVGSNPVECADATDAEVLRRKVRTSQSLLLCSTLNSHKGPSALGFNVIFVCLPGTAAHVVLILQGPERINANGMLAALQTSNSLLSHPQVIVTGARPQGAYYGGGLAPSGPSTNPLAVPADPVSGRCLICKLSGQPALRLSFWALKACAICQHCHQGCVAGCNARAELLLLHPLLTQDTPQLLKPAAAAALLRAAADHRVRRGGLYPGPHRFPGAAQEQVSAAWVSQTTCTV